MVRIINICSGKGGVGKTTVAANLGYVLQKLGKKTVIIDFNLTTSHLALQFGFYDYQKTFNDFLRNEISLKESIYIHSSGLSIVPASLDLKDLINIDVANLKERIKETFEDYDFVLLDSAPGLGRESIVALKSCDEILFVANPYIPSLVDILKYLNLIKRFEYKPNIIGIVLNKVKNKNFEIKKEEIQAAFGLPVIGIIPEDDSILEALNRRILVTMLKKSRASEALWKLGSKIAGIEYKKSSFFSSLFSIFKR